MKGLKNGKYAGASEPDIIHPAADKKCEHLLDVEPEVVPELFLQTLIKCLCSYQSLVLLHQKCAT